METLLAVTGFVIVAAITPGPNNFIVMTAAARGGMGGAIPAITGVVLGSLGLLVLVWLGGGVAFAEVAGLRAGLAIAGSAYLAWLGLRMLWQSHDVAGPRHDGLPRTATGVAVFQFLNPKGWVMIVTATAAVSGTGSLVVLGAILVGVTSVCLMLWAGAGSALAGLLASPRPKRRFDWVMGGLLIGSAVLLIGSNP